MGVRWLVPQTLCMQAFRPVREENSMIQFEEELAKFRFSKEIDEVETVLRSQTTADVTDLLAEVMEEKRKNQ